MARRDRRQRATRVTHERSQLLRKNSTYPEQLLWSMLRGKQLSGLRFRRQHPIEPYIVDFYCASARLAIELDGKSHDEREKQDQQRSKEIEKQCILVMRVSNDDVLTNLEGVLKLISRSALSRSMESGRTKRVDCG